MQIRPYREGDEDAVIALWQRCDLLRPWNDARKDIARKLRVQRELFLVAERERAVVGTVMAGYEGHRGWVNYLAVAPELRGSGIGRALMDEAEARLRAFGCPKLNLQVRSGNAGATAFYARLGYLRDDAVSLGKRLEPDGPADVQQGARATLEVWFEFASTYSYPGVLRVEPLASAEGIALAWRPFLLGPIFRSQGWNDSPFNLQADKGRYMWRDLERICAEHALAFRRPSVFPRSGVLAARVACCAEAEPWLPEFVRRVYTANFAEDREISARAVLADILAELGQPDAWLKRAESPDAKDRLRRSTEEAVAHGIFGAPTFRIDGELFWGNDRLEAALAWARRSTSAILPAASQEDRA
jgi:2-hydroxychromene-2-carboxylate isomerase/predicted N-acetyltransferase YhbS